MECGGDHAVQPGRGDRHAQLLQGLRRTICLRGGDARERQVGPPGGGQVVEEIRCKLRRDEQVALTRLQAQVADGLAADAAAHERAEHVAVSDGIFLKKCGAQAGDRPVFPVVVLVLIFRQPIGHGSLRVRRAAPEAALRQELPQQGLLPRRQEHGCGGNAALLRPCQPFTGLCQQQALSFVVRQGGNLFLSVHCCFLREGNRLDSFYASPPDMAEKMQNDDAKSNCLQF